jgi:hypothetical protein
MHGKSLSRIFEKNETFDRVLDGFGLVGVDTETLGFPPLASVDDGSFALRRV